MKKWMVLLTVFMAAIFFYPVFAHAEKIGYFLEKNPLSEPAVLFILGSGLLVAAGLARRLVRV